jgi:uncharacterized membrane-anchored protein YjiN (DUF445 family)
MHFAEIDVAKLDRLNRMKMLATGLLLLMTAVFMISKQMETSFTWLTYVRAFSEAAMIGALADWFAVTALFRHPLGIPVPHTAIIPNRKNEIGENLARFVKDNFLIVEAMVPKLHSVDFATRTGQWLKKQPNAEKVAEDAGAFARWFLGVLDNTTLRHFLRENLNLAIREVPVTPLVGQFLDLLTAGGHHQELVDLLVRVGRAQLVESKYAIRERIKDQSPWWLPKFVDQEIYDKVVMEIEDLLDEVGADSDHAARRRFNKGVQEFVEKMKNDPEVIARGEQFKDDILAQPEVQKYFFEIWQQISEYLASESANKDSRIRRRIEHGIVKFGEALLESPEMSVQVNEWIRDAVMYVVTHYRDEIADTITDTVRNWDAKATADRIELQVGRDLQFIRINGTLVGGLVGLTIHMVWQLMA